MPELIFGVKIETESTHSLKPDEIEATAKQILIDAFGPKIKPEEMKGEDFLKVDAGGCTIICSRLGGFNGFIAKVRSGSLDKNDCVKHEMDVATRGFNEILAGNRKGLPFKPPEADAKSNGSPSPAPNKAMKATR